MEDSEEIRRIWNIREYIDEIEGIKNRIVEQLHLDSIWINDVKDLYFHVVSSWQLLKSCPVSEGTELEERAHNARSYLELAKDKYAQVQSELDAISGTIAVKMSGQLERAFILYFEAMSDALEVYLTESVEIPPEKIIRTEGPREFYLVCSICGATCVTINGNPDQTGSTDRIIYKGITTGTTLDMNRNEHIFDMLKREALKELHEYLQENTFLEDGIDAYCPKCDTVYCGIHMDTQVVYDDGF
ncbi:MAG: hypothetical protein ACFFED_14050, partial [Candidatus Thorarchaeota archaeon]